jgi:hypothetical protein
MRLVDEPVALDLTRVTALLKRASRRIPGAGDPSRVGSSRGQAIIQLDTSSLLNAGGATAVDARIGRDGEVLR